LSAEVLVLNSDYEPLNICNARRAVNMLLMGKVEVVHESSRRLHSTARTLALPSVVRLRCHIKRPRPQLKLSRRSILARDDYTCQYCGHKGNDMTVDHVIPKRMGGPSSWENLLCCCRKCNSKKGDKTVSQVGFTINSKPIKPRYVPFISYTKFLAGARDEVWRMYLPVFDHESRAEVS